MGSRGQHLPADPFFELDLFANLDDGIIAEVCGLSRRTLVRWRRGGIPWLSADRVSAHLQVHPILIWGDAWIELDVAS